MFFKTLMTLISFGTLLHNVGAAELNAFGEYVLSLYFGTSRISSLDDLRILMLPFSCVYVCVCVCVRVCAWIFFAVWLLGCMCNHKYVCAQACMSVPAYLYVCVRVCVHACMRVSV